MDNCKDCAHAIFDERWGEYKCKERACKVPVLLNSYECRFYKKKDKNEEEKES